MTCIVYRDGVLAADTLVVDETSAIYHAPKIYRLDDGSLIGAAGNGREILTFLNCYLQNIEPPKDYEYTTFAGILVKPSGDVYYCETHDLIDQVMDEYLAIGSGRNIAYGALEMGASAEEAVRMACKYSIYCGLPITTLRLRDA